MALFVNCRGFDINPSQNLQEKDKRGVIIFQSILRGLYYPDTKTRQNYQKKTNILYE